MKRFVEGHDRGQSTLFPECLEDWIDENNPVRVIDVFVDGLDLAGLGFVGVDLEATGRLALKDSRTAASTASSHAAFSAAAIRLGFSGACGLAPEVLFGHAGRLRPQDKTPTFRSESIPPGGRDSHAADIDEPAAGPDLLACQGRKSTFDQPGDHADAKSVCHEQRLRDPIEARAREHSQRAALSTG